MTKSSEANAYSLQLEFATDRRKSSARFILCYVSIFILIFNTNIGGQQTLSLVTQHDDFNRINHHLSLNGEVNFKQTIIFFSLDFCLECFYIERLVKYLYLLAPIVISNTESFLLFLFLQRQYLPSSLSLKLFSICILFRLNSTALFIVHETLRHRTVFRLKPKNFFRRENSNGA